MEEETSFQHYLNEHNRDLKGANLESNSDYNIWLHNLQEQSVSLDFYYPGILDGGIIPDSFDCSSAELIGSRLKVLYDSEVKSQDICVMREINGRILSARHDEALDRWEHLVYFKDNDREDGHWLSLREHACYVGSEMVWFKSRYWVQKDAGQRFPMQVLLPSGMSHLKVLGFWDRKVSPQHFKAQDRAKYYEQANNIILTQLYVPPPKSGSEPSEGNVCITQEIMAKYSYPSDPLITPLDGSIPEHLVREHMITYRNLSGLNAINYALAMCEIEEQQNVRRLSVLTPQESLENGGAMMRSPCWAGTSMW